MACCAESFHRDIAICRFVDFHLSGVAVVLAFVFRIGAMRDAHSINTIRFDKPR